MKNIIQKFYWEFLLVGTFFVLGFLGNNSSINPGYLNFWIILSAIFLGVGLTKAFLVSMEEMESENFSKKTLIFSLVAFVITSLMMSGLPIANKLSKVLPINETNISSIEFEGHRSVTREIAFQKANKIIGKKVNGTQISSQFEIDKSSMSVQRVNGKLLWVLPLDYSGFFKWINQDYIPGYVTVSATDASSEAELHIGHKIKLSKNAYFMDSIDRVMFFKSLLSKCDTHFEINDKGEAFYITLELHPDTFGLNLVTTSVYLTSESGKTTKYDPESVPSWVDRIVAEDTIESQLEWYGEFSGGALNYLIFGNNISTPTKYNGRELWITIENGREVYFTGFSSLNKNDNSLVKGVVVDTRTGEAKSFDLSDNMDEEGAIVAANSQLGADAIKWEPVLPQPLIINGKFYWAVVIVSKDSHIFQKFALVDGRNQSNVFFANSLENAEEHILFKKSVNSNKVEYIKVRKDVLEKILQKIEELQELKKQL